MSPQRFISFQLLLSPLYFPQACPPTACPLPPYSLSSYASPFTFFFLFIFLFLFFSQLPQGHVCSCVSSILHLPGSSILTTLLPSVYPASLICTCPENFHNLDCCALSPNRLTWVVPLICSVIVLSVQPCHSLRISENPVYFGNIVGSLMLFGGNVFWGIFLGV